MINRYLNGIKEKLEDTEEAEADDENYLSSGHDNSAKDKVEDKVDDNIDDDIPNFFKEAKKWDGYEGEASVK